MSIKRAVPIIILFLLGLVWFYGCWPPRNPNGPFDISFHHEADIIIPVEGGKYSFTAMAVTTKSWGEILGYFEYKVIIDEVVYHYERKRLDGPGETHINDGDTWEIEFEIPENDSSDSRVVIVKTHILSWAQWENGYTVADYLYDTIWQGIQLGKE